MTNENNPEVVPCDECGFDDVCIVGEGDNPLCGNMLDLSGGCCCPSNGCKVQMR